MRRIVIAAVLETLDYLPTGGRLSKSSWMVGKLLSLIVTIYDDLSLSIACHWGPNAFGFIYVKGE